MTKERLREGRTLAQKPRRRGHPWAGFLGWPVRLIARPRGRAVFQVLVTTESVESCFGSHPPDLVAPSIILHDLAVENKGELSRNAHRLAIATPWSYGIAPNGWV